MLLTSIKSKICDVLACAVPCLFFLLVTFRFWGEAPALDPMVIYRESTIFHKEGFSGITRLGYDIHPPLIYLINSLFFTLFGYLPGSYNLAGFSVFAATEVIFYLFVRRIYGRGVGVVSTWLLFGNPLVIVNSFYLGNDLLIMSGLILSLTALILNFRLIFSLSLGLIVLMKEPALVVIGGYFLLTLGKIASDLLRGHRKSKTYYLERIFPFLLPSLFFIAWSFFLRSSGTHEWREHLFIEGNKNSFLLVFDNFLKLKIFNVFLFQNLVNLFSFNFQWFYILLASSSLLASRIVLRQKPKFDDGQRRTFSFLFFLSLLYILLALSFPTWTVLRYGIPVYPLIFLGFGLAWMGIPHTWLKSLVFSLALILTVISNFITVDPITIYLNGGFLTLDNQRFYNTSFWYGGPDRIDYNQQFLTAVADQNRLIKKFVRSGADVLLTYCDRLKLGEKIWSITVNNEFYPKFPPQKKVDCINDYNLAEDYRRLEHKVIYLDKNEADRLANLLKTYPIMDYRLLVGDF